MVLSRPTWDLVECACGTIRLSPMPTAADILAMYSESEQFDTSGSSQSYYRGARSADVLEYITSSLASLMRSQGFSLHASLRVLEVGAGLAWMCRATKMLGYHNLTVAQDLSGEVVSECRWVDRYLVEDLLEAESADAYAPYDVISMTHVIEHLIDPVTMLQRLAGLLSDRGTIFVTAPFRPKNWHQDPNPDAWRTWSYNHVPAHTQYFSRQGLETACALADLTLVHWDSDHDDGQAFEAWIRHRRQGEPA